MFLMILFILRLKGEPHYVGVAENAADVRNYTVSGAQKAGTQLYELLTKFEKANEIPDVEVLLDTPDSDAVYKRRNELLVELRGAGHTLVNPSRLGIRVPGAVANLPKPEVAPGTPKRKPGRPKDTSAEAILKRCSERDVKRQGIKVQLVRADRELAEARKNLLVVETLMKTQTKDAPPCDGVPLAPEELEKQKRRDEYRRQRYGHAEALKLEVEQAQQKVDYHKARIGLLDKADDVDKQFFAVD